MIPTSAREFKNIADDYFARCRAREEPPQVNELAAEFALPAADFSNWFLKIVGERPGKYLRRCQIECAKQLLVETNLPMNAIAYKCGFNRRTTFFRAFKRTVGMTPGRYRALHRVTTGRAR